MTYLPPFLVVLISDLHTSSQLYYRVMSFPRGEVGGKGCSSCLFFSFGPAQVGTV